MGTLIMIAQLILALAILVSLHEWEHYIASRAFGIRVEKFFIFFDAWGVKLFSRKRGDTEWGIGWLPLGGYVKIAGMIDESLDKEQLKTPPKDDEFRGKPAWQRLIVMIGGVTVNFVLGILIFSLYLFYYGDAFLPNQAVIEGSGIMVTELGQKTDLRNGDKLLKVNGRSVVKFRDLSNPDILLGDTMFYEVKRDEQILEVGIPGNIMTEVLENKGLGLFEYRFKTVVGKVASGSNAKEGGLEAEDRIVSVNGTTTVYFDEFQEALNANKGNKVALGIIRNNEEMTLDVQVDTAGKLGFYPTNELEYKDQLDTTRFGFIESFPAGTVKGINTLGTQIKAFGKMISGKMDPTKSLMGPIQMTKLFGSEWKWSRFWHIVGLLSLILAFMNLLPIPALDGGHVLFLLVEMVIGRPLPDKFMYVMQVIGMILLFGLMAFVFGIDIFSFLK